MKDRSWGRIVTIVSSGVEQRRRPIPGHHPARPLRQAGGVRGRGGVPGERAGGLRHGFARARRWRPDQVDLIRRQIGN